LRLLRDTEIADWVAGRRGYPPLLVGFALPDPPYGRDSPIQPSSLDLTIGAIFLPEAQDDEEGGVGADTGEHWLKPGHTAVVVTRERLNFPPEIAGFGFPPTRISSSGILMTNPGHIDPGFEGYLKFTVINMGKRRFQLRRGDAIVTCLLVQLDAPAHADYKALGHEATAALPSRASMNRLTQDFLDFTDRATEIATRIATAQTEAVRNENKRRDIGVVIGVTVAFLVALLPLYFGAIAPFAELREKVAEGHALQKTNQLEQALERIESRLKVLEQKH
jgi:dCTP deaminase